MIKYTKIEREGPLPLNIPWGPREAVNLSSGYLLIGIWAWREPTSQQNYQLLGAYSVCSIVQDLHFFIAMLTIACENSDSNRWDGEAEAQRREATCPRL